VSDLANFAIATLLVSAGLALVLDGLRRIR
jgi:hypothetical protein